MECSIYIADLRHDYIGVLASDCMPLGISYIKAIMDRDLPAVRSRMFAYPDGLWNVMKSEPPDVLMLANYCWNEALNIHFARMVKQLRPETLVVMGGPNIHLEPERQINFFCCYPQLDVYVLGEGDFLATEVVKHYLAAGKSIAKMGEREIPSCIYRRPQGEVIRQEMWDRHRGLNEIPSPWLTGIQDTFFDGKLAPMIETNRGCPFKCTFCVQGVDWYTKVNYFDKDRIKEEIEYIARLVKKVCPSMGTLRIADSNYGMFEQDIEISGYIGEVQKKYGYPSFIDATTGKNRPDRIIKSIEKANGALVFYHAVQSLDEDVLRKVKRQNIKIEAYDQVQIHLRGRGLRSSSDLILALPGESLQSHLVALHKLVDAGTSQMHNFQAMMLKGSELETLESRKDFSFETRVRVLPKTVGIYNGEKVFDIEEIVVATDTLPFEDYLEARKYHLVCSVFWNDSWFEDAVRFAEILGIRKSDWFDAILPAMEAEDGAVRGFLDSFVSETIHELFPTRNACIEFYNREDNFQRLMTGEIGDNLMYKYRAIASFHLWSEICRCAMDATKRLILNHGALPTGGAFNEFWSDFHRFIELKHASGRTMEEILSPGKTVFAYDIGRWIADGQSGDFLRYKLEQPVACEFSLSPEGARELEAALKVWTQDLKGLTKMVTRIRVSSQVRQCRSVNQGHCVPRGT